MSMNVTEMYNNYCISCNKLYISSKLRKRVLVKEIVLTEKLNEVLRQSVVRRKTTVVESNCKKG